MAFNSVFMRPQWVYISENWVLIQNLGPCSHGGQEDHRSSLLTPDLCIWPGQCFSCLLFQTQQSSGKVGELCHLQTQYHHAFYQKSTLKTRSHLPNKIETICAGVFLSLSSKRDTESQLCPQQSPQGRPDLPRGPRTTQPCPPQLRSQRLKPHPQRPDCQP